MELKERNKIYLLILIVACMLLYNCNNTVQKRTITQLLQEWKNDSLGCLRIRNDSVFNVITDSIPLKGKPYEDVISMFGNPNKLYIVDSAKVATYYLDMPCKRVPQETGCYI